MRLTNPRHLPFFLTFTVLSLSIYAQDTTTIQSTVRSMFPPGSLYVGTAAHETYLGTHTEEVIDREFDYITPANDFKQSYIHPRPGSWNWVKSDKWVNHCRESGQVIRMHAPIGPQVSVWSREDSRTPEELETNLAEFLTGLCQRYNDSSHILWLDVVNETILPDGSWAGEKPGTDVYEVPWTAIGFDESVELRPPLYIKQSFEYAKEHGPNLKLIINQHTASDASWQKMRALVHYLRNLGLRVDGLGWQAHVNKGWEKSASNMARLDAFIDWCHANDLEFHITEFNVWLNPDEEPDYDEQAATFYAITKLVASKYNTGVIGINYWHIRAVETANPTWDGCLWMEDYVPKQGYYDVKRALYEVASGIGPSITSTPVKSGIVGLAYSYQVETRGVIGTPIFKLSIDKPVEWLTLSRTGKLSGYPVKEDTIQVTITVTDDMGPRTQEFTLMTFNEYLQITSSPVNVATVGSPYEYHVTNTGEGTYTVSANPDAPWLQIDENGLIKGTPAEKITTMVTVGLTRNDVLVTQQYNLEVFDSLRIISSPGTIATAGVEYKYFIHYDGYATFQVITDKPADWLKISQQGILYGTPSEPDTLHVTITASNDLTTVTQEFDLIIGEPLTITSSPVTTAHVSSQYQYQIGFTGTGSFTLTTAPEAGWLSISQEGLLSGTPTKPGSVQVTVKLRNQDVTRYQAYSLDILPAVNINSVEQSKFIIHPNPAGEFFTVQNLVPGNTITIYDIAGLVVFSKTVTSTIETFPAHSLESGAYIIKTPGNTGMLLVK